MTAQILNGRFSQFRFGRAPLVGRGLCSSLLALLALGLAVGAVSAAPIVDNTGGVSLGLPTTNRFLLQNSGTTSRWAGTVFQTAAVPGPLKYAWLGLGASTSNGTRNFTLDLYAVDAANKPTGSVLATSTSACPVLTTTGQYCQFSYSGVTLNASTKYALVVKASTTDSEPKSYWHLPSPNNAYVSLSGFSWLNTVTTINQGSAWTTSIVNTARYAIQVNAYPCGEGITLSTTQWQMLAAPCQPTTATVQGALAGNGSTVDGNLNAADYNAISGNSNTVNQWLMSKRDPLTGTTTGTYVRQLLSSAVNPGDGFWIKSGKAPNGAAGTKLGINDGTDTVASQNITGCQSPTGYCVAIQVYTVSSDNRYNLVGNPFAYPVDWSMVMVLVDDTAYTPSEAETAGYLSKNIWIWNGTSYSTYDDVTLGSVGNLEYFKSFWVNVLPSAYGKTVKLVIPASVSSHTQGAPLTMAPISTDRLASSESLPWYLSWVDWLIAPAAAESVKDISVPGKAGEVMDVPKAKSGKPGVVPDAPDTIPSLAERRAAVRGLAAREAARNATKQAIKEKRAWYVRLKVVNTATGWEDRNSVFGQLPDSQDGYDRHDLPEMAPFATPYLTIVFPHSEWGVKKGDYATDFRAAQKNLSPAEWSFEVRANPVGSNVVLSWEGNPEILGRSVLTDNLTGQTIKPSDRRYAKGYPMTLSGASHSFTWSYLGAAKR